VCVYIIYEYGVHLLVIERSQLKFTKCEFDLRICLGVDVALLAYMKY